MSKTVYSDGHREVRRIGDPTAGGAYARYMILDSKFECVFDSSVTPLTYINFQSNTISEIGVQGATNEALLAIVIDRLECFQASEFNCIENGAALTAAKDALVHLEMRTVNRKARGVEGKHEV